MARVRNSLVARLKRLQLTNLPLVGRDSALQDLREAIDSKECPLVAVSGYSGVGKTALVENIADDMEEREEGWFAVGKYDQQASSRPYAGMSIALGQLAKKYGTEIQTLLSKTPLNEEQISLLLGVVPSLKHTFSSLIPLDTIMNSIDMDTGTVHGKFRSERIQNALAAFIQILCRGSSCNIVILLDDVQWADCATFDVVKKLAEDESTANDLTVILTYRTNELQGNEALKALLQQFDSSLFILELGNLSLEHMNVLVAHILELRSDEAGVLDLTRAIQRKTEGNVLLMWLQRKMILYYSLKTYRWEWELTEIDAEADLSENVVDIVAGKLRDLPISSRRAIMVGSCLGSRFETTLIVELLRRDVLLPILADDDEGKVLPDFGQLVEEGVLNQYEGTQTFRFGHDRIQQAAHSLFETQRDREGTHLRIGKVLIKMRHETGSLANSDLQRLLATDQLNLGASSIFDEKEKLELVRHNHEAALIAIAKSAFVQAERFHRTAVELSPKRKLWSEHYDLAIAIYSAWTETLVTLGELDEIARIADEVMTNARHPSDCNRIVYSKIERLNSLNCPQSAYDLGLEHLRKCGMKLPRKANKLHVIFEFLRVKRFLKKIPLEALLEREECDATQLEHQRLLLALSDTSFLSNEIDTMTVLYLKVLNMAFMQGPSKFTAPAMIYLGVVLGASGNFQGSYDIYNAVNKLANRFNARTCHSRIYVVAHCFLYHLRNPLQDSLDKLLESYAAAMASGDVMHACNAAQVYVQFYFFCGLSLDPLLKDVTKFNAVFVDKGKNAVLRCLLDMFGQTVLNLTGKAEDPFEVDGDLFKRDAFLIQSEKENNDMGSVTYSCMGLLVSYIMDPNSEQVSRSFDEVYYERFNGHSMLQETLIFSAPPFVMSHCLAAIALERKTGKRKYRRKRKYLLKLVKKFVSNGVPAVSHRLLLIQAEVLALDSKASEIAVKGAFEKAISTAKRTGFTQDCAIANERCGNYFQRQRDTGWAEHYLEKASQLYEEWGATAKTDLMLLQYPFLQKKTEFWRMSSCQSSGLRARERFNSTVADRHNREVAQLIFESGDPDSQEQTVEITVDV